MIGSQNDILRPIPLLTAQNQGADSPPAAIHEQSRRFAESQGF